MPAARSPHTSSSNSLHRLALLAPSIRSTSPFAAAGGYSRRQRRAARSRLGFAQRRLYLPRLTRRKTTMTRTEFSEAMAWLEVACGKPIYTGNPQEQLARMQVYFDVLGELPLPVLRVAAQRAIL